MAISRVTRKIAPSKEGICRVRLSVSTNLPAPTRRIPPLKRTILIQKPHSSRLEAWRIHWPNLLLLSSSSDTIIVADPWSRAVAKEIWGFFSTTMVYHENKKDGNFGMQHKCTQVCFNRSFHTNTSSCNHFSFLQILLSMDYNAAMPGRPATPWQLWTRRRRCLMASSKTALLHSTSIQYSMVSTAQGFMVLKNLAAEVDSLTIGVLEIEQVHRSTLF